MPKPSSEGLGLGAARHAKLSEVMRERCSARLFYLPFMGAILTRYGCRARIHRDPREKSLRSVRKGLRRAEWSIGYELPEEEVDGEMGDGLHHGEEFVLVGVLVDFGFAQGHGVEPEGVIRRAIGLVYDFAKGHGEGIGLHDKGLGRVGEANNGGFEEGLEEALIGTPEIDSPHYLGCLAEGVEGPGLFREVGDEGAVIVAEEQLTEFISTAIGDWPITECVEFAVLGADAFLEVGVAEVEEGVQ